MKSLNIAVLGDHEILKDLGKLGTTSDISLYDKKMVDKVFTWVSPITFPEKIQSLVQVINMTELVVLNVKSLDKYFAEQIIALDSLQISEGFILHSYDVDHDRLQQMIKDTTVANFRILDDVNSLKIELNNISPISNEGHLIIPIDHSFDVKGVGTVILGVIKQGSVKIYDKLKILPSNKEILVKSIQMHDDPVNEASSPARVGLSLKGVSPDEIERGDIISDGEGLEVSPSELIVPNLSRNRYYKNEISQNQTYLISVGLQIKPVKIIFQDSKIKLLLEKQIVYNHNQKFLILKPDSKSTRIIAQGLLP